MWYRPSNESSISTPAILLYPDRIEENIRRMIAIAGSPQRLRPHVKTHKIGEVVQMQIRQGITKFKCATLNELEMVAGNGGQDILMAYPLVGPGIMRFFEIMGRFPEARMAATVDSIPACSQLRDQAVAHKTTVGLFVDVDNGMHRTGIAPEGAVELTEYIMNSPALYLRGLHVYDGHIHDGDVAQRKIRCDRDFEGVTKLIGELEAKGVRIEELACGGTPSFPIHAAYPDRTLCPGTTLLWDAGYAKAIPDLDFLNAAVVAGRVISKPMQQVCLDLGHKSIASEMAHPRLQFLEMEISGVLNHSEEHLVVSTGHPEELSVGDLVYALPVHICPTMALHEKVYVVSKGKVEGMWEVAARRRTYSR